MGSLLEIPIEGIDFEDKGPVDPEAGAPDSAEAPRQRRRRTTPGAAPKPRVSGPRGKALAQALADPLVQVGAMLTVAAPTTGTVLCMRAEVSMQALVSYASDKPKLMEALQKVSKVGPMSTMVQSVLMLVVAAQLDLGAIDPSSPIATLTGVTAIHYGIREEMAGAAANWVPDAPPPGWSGAGSDAPTGN